MKLKIICLDRVKDKNLKGLIEEYVKRLGHYTKIELKELKAVSKGNYSADELIKKEWQLFEGEIESSDLVIVLDEYGKQFRSLEFANLIQGKLNQSIAQLAFIIGGAYGVHEELKSRADLNISLSAMTFTHDMCRVILLEQIYRAFTILKGEKYHNE